MRLTTKFNLVLFTVFSLGLVIAGYISYTVLHKHAREEVLNHAGMMMEAAMAIRGYTVKEIRPLLKLQMKREFLPQSVPSYAATQNFKRVREIHPEYTYKEAALNPTNPRDDATDWETDIIQIFRNDPETTELSGERVTPLGKSLYYARPIRISNKNCLTCHSTSDAAPETMVKLYGAANGFGWQLDEVVGSQIVSVPLSVPLAKAQKEFMIFMASLISIFATIFIVINIMLNQFVVKRVREMAHVSDEISTGHMEVPEFSVSGKDEIADLSRSFNRMRRSLEKAMKMLNE
jgi:nitrate/nitrite-specific signal transduction histidine kinase